MEVPIHFCPASPHRAMLWHAPKVPATSFTYAQLAAAANVIREALDPIQDEAAFIGVLYQHDPVIVAILLGIMQANHPFVCIDPLASESAIRTQLATYKVPLFFTANRSHQYADFCCQKTIQVLDTSVHIYSLPIASAPSGWFFPKPILFGVSTSGSTGPPKSLAVPLQCFRPNVDCLQLKYGLTAADRVYVSAPPTFDPFVLDLLIALRSGATIVLVSPELRLDSQRLSRLLFTGPDEDRCTVMPSTPSLLYRFGESLLQQLVFAADTSLRLLIVGGESCPDAAVVRRWFAGSQPQAPVRLLYLYGLTEQSCWSMAYEVKAEDYTSREGTETLPLGELLTPGETWSLCDPDTGAPLPAERGTVGELVLHSTTRFTFRVDNLDLPIPRAPGQSALRTGDICELNGAGELQYRCRLDHQIKRHGTCVSVQHIEQLCRTVAGVGLIENARCLWLPKRGGSGLLALFVQTPRTGRAELLRQLRSQLPASSVPDEVHCVAEWPVTAHGKFDYRAVLEAANRRTPHPESVSELFVRQLVDRLQLDEMAAWSQRSFTVLGGSSFEAMYLTNWLQQQSGHKLPALTGWLLSAELPLDTVISRLAELGDRSEPAPLEEPAQLRTANLRWAANAYKCVDASPTILRHLGAEYVAIGSHSHRLLTLRVHDGSLQCSLQLPDRIESQVRQFGQPDECSWAAVGCYDGLLYAYDFRSGELLWSAATGAMIKSCALWLPQLDCLLVGSYLQTAGAAACNVWSLQAETGGRSWSRRIGEASICASPIALGDDCVVCTLDGTCARLRSEDGSVVWQHRWQVPMFATPMLLVMVEGDANRQRILVADVEGLIRCLDAAGRMEWTFKADGNVFSSFELIATAEEAEAVCFGCQDGHVYCVRTDSGAMRWRSSMGAPVFARPLMLRVPTNGRRSLLAINTKGELGRLCADSGRLLDRWRVKGEVFSSPVEMSDGCVVFGSRSDWVNCVDLAAD